MNYDKFVGAYISSAKQRIQSLKDDLAAARLADLYEAGLIQGEIRGLELSLNLLQAAYEEQDI